jgi:hypothetical protein
MAAGEEEEDNNKASLTMASMFGFMNEKQSANARASSEGEGSPESQSP